MNSFVRFMCVAVVFACMSSSFQVVATSDERSAYLLESILVKKHSLIDLWKLGLIMLEDSQGKPVDMIQFIWSIHNYLSKSHELDQAIVTVQNVNRALKAIDVY